MRKFEQIRAFLAVVDENGFSAAARKQNISTAAVSKHVSQLEFELKVQLLHRTTRKITLTEIGAQYYHQCKKTVNELAEIEARMTQSQNEATGLLHILSNRYFAEHYLLPHLSSFLQDNPSLKVNLELAERFPHMMDENIDVIFGVSMEGALDLVRRKIRDTRYVFCASPSYLSTHGTPKDPTELKDHHYITHKMRAPNNSVTFKNGKTVFVEPLLYLNDSRAMAACAVQGLGIVKLHDYFVESALNKGQLTEIFTQFCEPKQPVYLYYQSSKYLTPKIRRFIDFIEPYLHSNLKTDDQ